MTSNGGAGTQPLNQLLLPAPTAPNGSSPPAAANPKLDLLSGDDYSSPKADTSLALVPVGETPPTTSVSSQQNALVLFDMFSAGTSAPNPVNTQPAAVGGQPNSVSPQFHQQQNFQTPEAGLYQNGTAPNTGSPRYEQSLYAQGSGSAWNGQLPQQQPPSPGYGAFPIFNRLFVIKSLLACTGPELHSSRRRYNHGTADNYFL